MRMAGNTTEVVAVASHTIKTRDVRSGSLFGAHPGSVTVREGVDLTAPVLQKEDLDELPDASEQETQVPLCRQ